ncbi:MAG: hypothetical protein LC096_04660, partial [Bacteroidia bacterium]|nr:hypothetical protein [Bacteroidia bacterium]
MPIILNENIQSNSPKSLDNKYLMDGVTPYADVADVNSTIPITYRSIGLKVNIANVDYWYQNGVADVDLVPFVSGGITIQDNGVDLPQQPKLNFLGISLKAQNNALNNSTDTYFTGKVCSIDVQPLNYTFGTVVNFTKVDYVPNADIVNSGLEITRDDSGEWLFNQVDEGQANPNSPTGSLWYGNFTSNEQFNDALSNLDNLSYGNFSDTVLNAIGSFDNLFGTLWIMKDNEGKYWSVFFTSWSVSQFGVKAYNYLFINAPAQDGTFIDIGNVGYEYNLALNQWTNEDGGSYTSLIDCINNDPSREVNASDYGGSIFIEALNDGVYGNSIYCQVSPNQSPDFYFQNNYLVGGENTSGGGGFAYQRAEIIVLCKGAVNFPDGTSQTTAPYQIQNEGVTLPKRQFLNFVGAGVDVKDIGGKTEVNILGNYKKIINVDSQYGDFAKASLDPYNQSLSFPSLQTAVQYAQYGDLIFVVAGNYFPNESIAKDGVDWYF